ncbi:MAG: hypothetical protein IH892_08335 [Planctomycetes bacterium]|nr:hypothetical protein [Planctomycetota bacterium]
MHSVLAIASNTLKQAVRMKLALVFSLLLLILLPVMAFGVTGDGTLKGRLQTFVSYGISLVSLLLSLLTIFAAIHTTTSDVTQRQVYTVLTKPIRRWEFLLGKFLGILTLNSVLLVLFGGIIYGVVMAAPRYLPVSPAEAKELHDQFYTARARVLARPIVVTDEEIQAEYDRLHNNQMLDQFFPGASVRKLKERLRGIILSRKSSVIVGGQRLWEFDDIRPQDPNEDIFVRFKLDVATTPPDEQIYARWAAGDFRKVRRGEETLLFERDLKHPIRTFREFALPSEFIAADGYLGVLFYNRPQLNQTVVMFSDGKNRDKAADEQSFSILYRAGTFTGNYLRGMLVLFFRLFFLAALAIWAATFLSFPVAVLLALVLFCTVSISGFILESFTYMGKGLQQIYGGTIELIIQGLPQFDKYSPANYLVDGKLIDWAMVNWASWTLIWAMLLMGLALAIFHYKELARDTS